MYGDTENFDIPKNNHWMSHEPENNKTRQGEAHSRATLPP